MGNVNTTPWMNLPNPVPLTDPGPDYANNLQSCINGIDQHNHSPGFGQQITPNGLSINSDLTFGGNSITNLKASIYSAQSSFATLLSTYVIGNDLYYNDGAGNVIQLTSGGLVNATSSGISSGTASAAFATGVLVVKSSSTSGANILMQSAVLTNAGNITNQLTLAAPTLSGSISITLPAIPAQTNFMSIDSSGNIAAYAPIANGITRQNLAPVGQQLSSSSGAGSVSSATYADVTNLNVTITTSGRPVMLILQPDGTNSISLIDPGNGIMDLQFYNSTLSAQVVFQQINGAVTRDYPVNYVVMDTPSAGTYVYKIRALVSGSGGAVANSKLIAYEL